jgi:hypothetical protein
MWVLLAGRQIRRSSLQTSAAILTAAQYDLAEMWVIAVLQSSYFRSRSQVLTRLPGSSD